MKLKQKFDIERLLRTDARHSRLEKLYEQKKRKHDDCESAEGTSQKVDNTSSSCSSTKKSSSSSRQSTKFNVIDPIMHVKVDPKKSFKFVRSNGFTVCFNIDSLVEYMLSTGDFSDPETRIPFTDSELKLIDETAKKKGFQKESVVDAKMNVDKYSELKFRRDALLALERCAGEVITDMLDIVENYEPDEAQMQLVMREFPTFLDYFKQLRDADASYASTCNSHWRQFMQGPPNKPNVDEYGLIHVVCHFLKSCEDGVY